MNLTKEKLQSLAHIQTSEVESDLLEARHELDGYLAQQKAIEDSGVTPANKVQHYFLGGKIAKGNEFIEELNQLLNYRKTL